MIKTIVSLVRLCICSLGIISSLSWGSVDSHVENRPDKHGIERIIALSPHAVEILFLLGAGDKIVATTMGEDVIVFDPFSLNIYQSRKLGTEISSVFGSIETDSNLLSLYS